MAGRVFLRLFAVAARGEIEAFLWKARQSALEQRTDAGALPRCSLAYATAGSVLAALACATIYADATPRHSGTSGTRCRVSADAPTTNEKKTTTEIKQRFIWIPWRRRQYGRREGALRIERSSIQPRKKTRRERKQPAETRGSGTDLEPRRTPFRSAGGHECDEEQSRWHRQERCTRRRMRRGRRLGKDRPQAETAGQQNGWVERSSLTIARHHLMRIPINASASATTTMAVMPNAGTAVDGCTVITPLTRRSRPLATVSFVAALPPSSVSWASTGSMVSVSGPGVAEGESWIKRCATWLPGSGALETNGRRSVASWKVSRSEIVPAAAGDDSNSGVLLAVMPARVKVIDCTDAAGA